MPWDSVCLHLRRLVRSCLIALRWPIGAGIAVSVLGTAISAQAPAASAPAAARVWRQQHERAILDEFSSLLAIPNLSRDRANIQKNAEAIAAFEEFLKIDAESEKAAQVKAFLEYLKKR